MTDPVIIVGAGGVYPDNLNPAIAEQKLYKQGRFKPAEDNMVFVFGSNEAGVHGAGAARYARMYRGAEMGVAFGHTGRAFAIPTKNRTIRNTLSLGTIRNYIGHFLIFADKNPTWDFQVTALGCGLAGLRHDQIAPMFTRAPQNCLFDTVWEPYLPARARFWGHF